MNPDQPTLRDWLAMNAPEDVLCNCQRIMDRPMPESGTLEHDLWWAEAYVRKRYIWADLAMRIRAEGMPPEPTVAHPEWAKWAARDEDGECFWYQEKPLLVEEAKGWNSRPRTEFSIIPGNPSWIPTNWRESKVRIK